MKLSPHLHLKGNSLIAQMNVNCIGFTLNYLLVFSAGVGRTGTYIALDMLVEESNKPTTSESQKDVDIFSCVDHLRKQRVAMVQTHVSV